MKSIKLILLATVALASFATALTTLTTQDVVASNNRNSEVDNEHEHSKTCNDDGDDCEVENVHKHLEKESKCDDNGCEGNSGVVINNEDSHENSNCNTHRADSANDPNSGDCKDKFHFKPAND